MEAFDKFVHEWGLLILILAVYARMRYGGANIRKFKEWDKRRAKWKRLKKKRGSYK